MWGDPADPPLLLHHGGRDHGRSWDRIAEGFEDAYRVLALDLRGHGDSQPEVGGEYAIRQNVIDLLALAELAGPPVFLLGHSYGGRIGYLAAGAFPERFRAFVSIEGPLEPSHGDPKPFAPEVMRSIVEARTSLEGRTRAATPIWRRRRGGCGRTTRGLRRSTPSTSRATPRSASTTATSGSSTTGRGPACAATT